MRRHLKVYVKEVIFSGEELPESSNRRFFPTLTDIRSHMYRATVKYRLSKIDQANVAAKVDEWRETYGDDSFYFRPHAEGDTGAQQNKLLFVHQTAWQRRLLNKYGKDICLLDATYKTTRYALPLFFVAVKTNVDFQVVGSFVIENESTLSIKEALGVLLEWSPSWSPSCFMTDNCLQEIRAIEQTFPGTSISCATFQLHVIWRGPIVLSYIMFH